MPTRTCGATPPIFGGTDGADAGAIRVDICEACLSAEQTIEMRFHVPGGLHDDVIIVIRDYILHDQRSGHRRRAEDVDASGAGRERVIGVCAIARNTIRDELVVVEIVERVVTVEGDARQTFIYESVFGDDIPRDHAAGTSGENSDACSGAGFLKAVVRDKIIGDRVVNDPGDECGRRVRSERDAAVEGIVADRVAADEIVVRRAGIVAYQNAAGVMFDGRGALLIEPAKSLVPTAVGMRGTAGVYSDFGGFQTA